MDGVRLPRVRGAPRRRPGSLAGDKGYGYGPEYAYLCRRGIGAVIPQRSGPCVGRPRLPVDPDTDKRRYVMERAVGWLKGCRSIATRHDNSPAAFWPCSSSPSSANVCGSSGRQTGPSGLS